MSTKLLLHRLSFTFILFLLTISGIYSQTFQGYLDESDIEKKCRIADELAHRYVYSDLDSLKMTGEHLLSFSNKKHSKKGINLAYFILGDYFTRTAEEQKGLELLRKAKNYYLGIEDYNKATRIHNAIGIAYQHLGNYKEACKWYGQSLKYGELASDEFVTYMALINLAQAQQAMENYDAAIESAEQYRDWVLKMGALDFVSNSFAVLGSISLDQEKYERAIYYFEQCYKFAGEVKDNSGKGHAYTNIGIVKYLQGDKEASERYFLKALEYRKSVRHVSLLCDAYLNYGGILFEREKYDQAIQSYQEGLRIAQKNNKHLNEIELLEALKEVYAVYDLEQVEEINKMLEIAGGNHAKTESEQMRVDELLAGELRESERIRKSGFVSESNRWPFYIGAFVLFIGFFFVVTRKKLN